MVAGFTSHQRKFLPKRTLLVLSPVSIFPQISLECYVADERSKRQKKRFASVLSFYLIPSPYFTTSKSGKLCYGNPSIFE